MNKWRFETYVLVPMRSFRFSLLVLVPIVLGAAPAYAQQQWGGGGIGASATPQQRLANSRVGVRRRMRVFSVSPSVQDTLHAPRATGGDWSGSQPQWGGSPPPAARPQHATPQAYIPTVIAGTAAIPAMSTYDPAAVRAHYMQRLSRP